MDTIVFLVQESKNDGRELCQQTIRQAELLAEKMFVDWAGARIIYARSAAGFDPPTRYSDLLWEFFLAHGVLNEQLDEFGGVEGIASEADVAAYFRAHPECARIWSL